MREELPLTFRDAVEADLKTLVTMIAEDQVIDNREQWTEPPPPCYGAALQEITQDPNNRLIVVESSGEIVGLMQLTFIPGLTYGGGRRAQIENVRVKRARRSQGIGRRMMRWAIDEAATRGCRLVQLTSNRQRGDAHRFYQSLGFQATHEGFKLMLDGLPVSDRPHQQP